MKKQILRLLLSCAFIISACNTRTADEEAGADENQQKMNVAGLWETGELEFTHDRCAFRMDLQNGEDLIVQDFGIQCLKTPMVGLFAPVRFVKADRSQFAADQIVGFTPPEGAKILALANASGLKARGWFHEGQRSFYFSLRLEDSVLFNQLSLTGHMAESGQLTLTKMDMKEGYTIQDPIALTRVAQSNANSILAGKTVWDRIRLLQGSVPSTEPGNQNFLYCVDATRPTSQGLVDLKTAKYSLGSGQFVGEIGFIDLQGENQVVMSRTDFGSVQNVDGLKEYHLFVTMPGGRQATVKIAFTVSGYAILTWNSHSRSLCRTLQNDVFKGRYVGWNP